MNLFKKNFSLIILMISFFFLLFTFYKSEIIWGGEKRNYFLNYYLIALLLIVFSIITFFLNDKIKEYLIIIGTSLLIGIYFFEGYLTFHKNISLPLKEYYYKKDTGKKWDKREKVEIYNDLKKINSKVVPSFHPELIVKENYPIFPLSSVSNTETIYCNENGYYSIYQSDRFGFNNPDDEWDQKEIEYLLVGDSFTKGACVNRPNDISSVLRILSNKSVLNLGMGGNGPLIEYAGLREYLMPNVKKVLWIYYEANDLNDLENEKKNNILINYLKDLNFTQKLNSKQNEINDLVINIINKKEGNLHERSKFDLFHFIKISNIRYFILPSPEPKPSEEFKKILKLAKKLIEKNNSKLYFVYLPQFSRYKNNHNNSNFNLVKDVVNELEIPFIDINKEVFAKEPNPLELFPFQMFGHYTDDGYEKVAKAIYRLTN